MAIDNIQNHALNAAPSLDPNALSLANSFPQAALYSPNLQPLYQSVDPTQIYPFGVRPQPFTMPESFNQFQVNPGLLTANLSSASDSVQGGLDQLASQADASLADANSIINGVDADHPLTSQQYQQLMQDYQNYQLLQQLIATIQSIIASVNKQFIDNMQVR